MIVYYRMCGVKLPTSSPTPFSGDPDEVYVVTRMCLRSFTQTYKSINPKIVFILDKCSLRYDKLIYDLVGDAFQYTIHHTDIGINESCLMQYRFYEKSQESIVLFLEYDYLWVKSLKPSAIEKLQVVTPYDHPDKYPDESSPIRIVDNYHFKHTRSTTATFACTKEYFTKSKDVLYKHGYIDHARWIELGGLHSPIPTMATHMSAAYLSPAIDWIQEYFRP